MNDKLKEQVTKLVEADDNVAVELLFNVEANYSDEIKKAYTEVTMAIMNLKELLDR